MLTYALGLGVDCAKGRSQSSLLERGRKAFEIVFNTMWPMRSFGILFSITLFRVFAVVQSSRAFADLPDRLPSLGGNVTEYRQPGESCKASDFTWYPVEDPRKFLYCDRRSRKLVLDTCASVNNVPKIFDERFQKCVMPAVGKLRTPGVPRSSAFGEPCMFNTDCLQNMYCPTGICLCAAGFVDSNQACVPAAGPGQPCSTDSQCRAYWPTTRCNTGSNRCECVLPPDLDATPAKYGISAYQSTEGWVCLVKRIDGTNNRYLCPLPIPFDAANTDTWQTNTAGPAMFNNAAGQVTCPGNSAASNCQFGANNDDWSDMGICVAFTPATAAGQPATEATLYVCCPNRAHTCMQPRPQNTQKTTAPITGESRYWYNQATGTCETVFWDGVQPFANNFKTREHCLAFCGGICPRGYTRVQNGLAQTCGTSCGSTTLTCTNVPTAGRELCCPTRAYICGTSGGRPAPSTGTTIAPTGIVSAALGTSENIAATTVDRYSFDGRTCNLIAGGYTGWGGFYNNFATLQDCNTFCLSSAACERGEPLKDASGQNQVCGRGCPSTYECRNNICCPKKQTVCIQPRRPGSCTQSIVRFWYNVASRDCEQFTYTGCGGNDNNFESYQSCVTYCREVKPEPQCIQGVADKDSSGNYYTCAISGAVSTCRQYYECYFDGYNFGCCPQRAYTCSLSRQVGSACVAPTTRWYYDTTTRSCQTFTYNGCDGNSNNFVNRQECERYCGVGGCPYGGEPYREASGAIRVCNAQVTCPTGYACNTVGVGGSSLNYCCQTRAFICQQSPVQGSQCSAQLQRYYFNIATRQCATFTYFGCGGNENNFATLSQCNNFCGSAACQAGEAAYIDPNSNRALTCNPNAANTCPQGYNCRSDTLVNNNVCCGSNDMGVCPAGERAYIEALTMAVRECQPSVAASCPNNFLCRPNNARNRYYCCATAASNICPAGRAVYRNPDTNQPQACFVSTVNPCPQDYTCQPTTTGQTQGYCCTINTLCPNAGEFYVETNTQQPRRCTVQVGGFNQCPTGYTCASNNAQTPTNGYCCRSGAANVCSTGQPNLVNGIATQCVPNQAPFCPAGYACTASSTGGGVFYCCTAGRQDGCPAGTTAFIPVGSGTAQMCASATDTTCPPGFSCQLSPTLNRFQCCSGGAQADGCPPGMIVYREPGTAVVRVCTFGGNQCPSPYSCQQSTAGRLQCCGLSGGCPAPMVAAISPVTGQPLLCTAGTACPAGFQCQTATNGQLTCCGTGTVTPPPPGRARCPFAGQTAYIIPGSGQVQTCRVGVQTCPAGYQCLNGGDGFVCCTQRTTGGGTLQGACPLGTSVYMNPVTGQAQTCSNSFTRCPTSYQCRYSSTLRNYYCCSVVNSGVAGADQCWGSCNPGLANSCIQGYTCRFVGDQSLCCRNSAAAAPAPMPSPSVFAASQPSQQSSSNQCWGTCNPSSPNSCISGYTCRYIGGQSYCCRNTGSSSSFAAPTPAQFQSPNTWSGSQSFQQAPDRSQCWGACNPGLANGCIQGYSCRYVGNQALCCRNSAASSPNQPQFKAPASGFSSGQSFQQSVDPNEEKSSQTNNGGCPIGEAPFFPAASAEPASCDKEKTPCPNNYSCTKQLDSEKSICCRPLAIPRQDKAVGGTLNADVDDEETNGTDIENGQCWGTCTRGGANTCIRGYTCQTVGTQSLCCRTGTVAAPVSGQFPPQSPAGAGGSSSSSGCPSGTAYMYPGTNSPLACQLASTGTGSCPVNYRCTRTARGNQCCPAAGRK